MQRLELLVRNAIDGVLGDGQPETRITETWLLDFEILRPDAVKQVITAIARLDKGKAITRGRVVAGLPFAFWAGLFGRRYEELWRRHLRRAFAPLAIASWVDPASRAWLARGADALEMAIRVRHESSLAVA